MRTRNTYIFPARMPSAFVLATIICLLVGTVGLAFAVTEDELKAELESLQKSMHSAAEAYEEQEQKLSEIQVQMEELAGQIEITERDLKDARTHLSGVVVERYRGADNYQLWEIMFSAKSFRDFITAFEYSSRMGDHYASAVTETRDLSEQLAEQRIAMDALVAEQIDITDSYRKQLLKLQGELADKEAEFEALREKLAAERAAANIAAGVPTDMDVTVSVGSNGFVFPVVGSYSYIDSFYA
ncbi:MAG: hypothetical protein FWE87_06170, partial [Coriobacteriia bacterium]|nr:hypothetical protein [Coriobacteriia bacterium]